MASDRLADLISRTRDRRMTAAEREEQRRSFAFGNANIENPRVTRALVDHEADRMSVAESA